MKCWPVVHLSTSWVPRRILIKTQKIICFTVYTASYQIFKLFEYVKTCEASIVFYHSILCGRGGRVALSRSDYFSSCFKPKRIPFIFFLRFPPRFVVILEKTIRIPRSLSVKASSVLKGFLNKNPADRLGCRKETGFVDIIHHPFFKSVDWEMVRFTWPVADF